MRLLPIDPQLCVIRRHAERGHHLCRVGGGARLELGLVVNTAVSILVLKHHLVVVAVGAPRCRLPLHLLLLVAIVAVLELHLSLQVCHSERLPAGSFALTKLLLLNDLQLTVVLLLCLVAARLVEDVLVCGRALKL